MSKGGGRACISRCRAMSIHGRAAWDYIPNPPRRSPFFGGAGGGGGGWRLLCAPTHAGGGGSLVGAPSGMAENTRWRPQGSWAPSRKNLGFAGGDSAIWYGMVRYSMVWNGMVWHGMVWHGMVWYVWHGTVRYGTVRYGMVRYGMAMVMVMVMVPVMVMVMVWYGMLLLLLLLRHPARAGGRNCQTRSPWAERKGGVTLAGRAPTTTEGGGGWVGLGWTLPT